MIIVGDDSLASEQRVIAEVDEARVGRADEGMLVVHVGYLALRVRLVALEELGGRRTRGERSLVAAAELRDRERRNRSVSDVVVVRGE